MTITKTTVTGPILDSNGVAYDRATIRFTPRRVFGDDVANAVLVHSPVAVDVAEITGAFTVDLAPSTEIAYDVALVQNLPDSQDVYRVGVVQVPEGGPVALQDLLPLYDPDLPTNEELLAALSAAVASAGASADTALQASIDAQSAADAAVSSIAGGLSSLADIVAQTIPAVVQYVVVIERVVGSGKLSGGRWFRSASEPDVPSLAKVQDASGAWFQLDTSGGIVRVEQLGGGAYCRIETETKAWYDACVVKPNYLTLVEINRFIQRLKWRDIWSTITSLYLFAGHDADASLINIKSPGTYDATANGSLTFEAGVGFTSTGDTGAYISSAPMNNLFSQNDACAYVGYSCRDTAEFGSIMSSTTGTSSGVGLNTLLSSGYLWGRLMGSASISIDVSALRNHRNGIMFVNRPDSTTLQLGIDGEIWDEEVESSAAPVSDTITWLRSGTDYVAGTVNFSMTGTALDAFQLKAVEIYAQDFLNEIAGKLSHGVMPADLGFVSPVTTAENQAAIEAAVAISSSGPTVKLGLGTYDINDIFPIKESMTVDGTTRRGTIISPISVYDHETPVMAPLDFKGGVSGARISNLTIDGRATERGVTSDGNSTPGGSNISSLGAVGLAISDIDSIDPALHSIDFCNTGEIDPATGYREYSADPSINKWAVGVRSRDCSVNDILCENVTDDGVTVHYSDFINCHNVKTWFTSGRHDSGARVSMSCEIDDGARYCAVSGVEAVGLARAAAAKSHAGHPSPIGCSFKDIVADFCAQALFLYDPDIAGGGQHNATGVIHTNPAQVHPDIGVNSVYMSGVTNSHVRGVYADGNGPAVADLGNAFKISGSSVDSTISGFHVVNWATLVAEDLNATAWITSTTSGCSLSSGSLSGCGLYGIRDTGGGPSTFTDIRVTGTGVAGSVGFRSTGTPDIEHFALRDMGGFDTSKDGGFL